MQAELDLRVSQDQVSALKKHNAQLACRCREEAKAKLKEHDERVETQDKVKRGNQEDEEEAFWNAALVDERISKLASV